ncbi:MAG: GAF domain-containing protein, partial [Armatimonadetes bacterium]|nr:GAF domain-containing protein [Armatimonadota bacterium]
LSVVVNNVKSLFGCDTCVVYLRDLENLQEPVLKVAQAVTATPDAFSDFNPNVKRSLIGEVFEQKKARLVRDFQEHQPEDAVRKDKGLRGVMVAPLLAEDDVLGVIFVGDAAVGRYGEAQLRLFGMLSMQVGLAVRAMQLQRKTEALAVTDSLSGLYTHGYFQDHLASSLSPAA